MRGIETEVGDGEVAVAVDRHRAAGGVEDADVVGQVSPRGDAAGQRPQRLQRRAGERGRRGYAIAGIAGGVGGAVPARGRDRGTGRVEGLQFVGEVVEADRDGAAVADVEGGAGGAAEAALAEQRRARGARRGLVGQQIDLRQPGAGLEDRQQEIRPRAAEGQRDRPERGIDVAARDLLGEAERLAVGEMRAEQGEIG